MQVYLVLLDSEIQAMGGTYGARLRRFWRLCRSGTSAAAARGVQGVIIQVLDPIEESFPFDGHVLFESMDGITAFDTPEAADLQIRYKQRLAARKDALTDLARRLGWQFSAHSTGASALSALLWAYGAMSVGR